MVEQAQNGRIQLVVSDIDGTLITGDGRVTPETLRQIRRVMAQGVHFSIASGRPTRRILEAVPELQLAIPVISSNGAVIEDVGTGEIIQSINMDKYVARQVVETSRRFPHDWVFVDTPEGWLYEAGPTAQEDRLKAMAEALDARPVGNLIGHLDREPTIHKMVVQAQEPVLEKLEEALRRVPGLYVTSSGAGNREIMLDGANKAKAAQLLAKRLGVKRCHVLAIGDNRNDLELIEWTGVGVAMENAVPELKQIADWVTSSNDEDGVARALERFVP